MMGRSPHPVTRLVLLVGEEPIVQFIGHLRPQHHRHLRSVSELHDYEIASQHTAHFVLREVPARYLWIPGDAVFSFYFC